MLRFNMSLDTETQQHEAASAGVAFRSAMTLGRIDGEVSTNQGRTPGALAR